MLIFLKFSFFLPEGLKSQVARHSLNYIQEIGNGWFGKVKCLYFLSHLLDYKVRVLRLIMNWDM